jgi:hypothetical protein
MIPRSPRRDIVKGARADFVYTVTRDFVRNCQTPILVLPDDVPGTPASSRWSADPRVMPPGKMASRPRLRFQRLPIKTWTGGSSS